MKLKKILAGILAVGMAAAYLPQTVMADESGTEIPVDQSKVLWGDPEGNGGLVIEIYNEFLETKNDPPINPGDIVDAKSVWVTFTIDGLDVLNEVDYTAVMAFADGSWNAADWASSINIVGDGTYRFKTNFEPAVANGVNVLQVNIAELGDALGIERYEYDKSKVDISGVKVELNASYEEETLYIPEEKTEADYLLYEELEDGTLSVTGYLGEGGAVKIPAEFHGKRVTTIGDAAFFECDSITSVDIPDSVTVIGDFAFVSCTSLTEVVIPDSVTTIGDAAFNNCGSLAEIVIPDSVTVIGEYAFTDCTSLTSIVVKENNSNYASVDGVLFDKNITLLIQYPIGRQNTKYTITDGVTEIGERAFEGSTFTEIVFPNGVTTIGSAAFSGCRSLADIVLPDSVTAIGSGAFTGCTSLKEIVIPDGVTIIANSTFSACSSLAKIVIPDSVTAIGNGAFYKCGAITEIVIPDGVTTLGTGVFALCDSLESLTIPASVTEVKIGIFAGPEDNVIPKNLTIYGYIGTAAEAFAKEYKINFVALDKEPTTPTEPSTPEEPTAPAEPSTPEEPSEEDTVIEDKETGIEISAADGVLPEGAALTVKADKENSSDTAVAFDITVTVDGKPATINGTVTVTIPVPEELKGKDKYYVYYKAEDGTLTDMKAAYADGYVTFITTHFSTYIISTEKLVGEDNIPNTGVTLLFIPAIVAAAGVIISKKRK